VRRALPALLALCAACNTLDPSRPIAIFTTGLGPDTEESLSNAAECWNMQFDTQLALGGAHDPGQTIEVAPSDFACLYAAGRTEPWLPVSIAICDQLDTYPRWVTFRVLLHELGHALNIRLHSADPDADMYPGFDSLLTRFADDDCARFYDANPSMPRKLACGAVSIDWDVVPGCSVSPSGSSSAGSRSVPVPPGSAGYDIADPMD
jgi:hypothetical protein